MKIRKQIKSSIEAKIAEIESHANVEIVPVLVDQSSGYKVYKLFLSALFFIFVLFQIKWSWSEWSLGREFGTALLGAVICYLLLSVSAISRHLVPAPLKNEMVERKAKISFLQNEVFATEKRTGLLIYVSFFEQAVYLVADKGLLKGIEEKTFAHWGHSLAHNFNRSQPGKVVVEALDHMAAELSKKFPISGAKKNELPNQLRDQ